jgi:hypothetical protein
MTLSKRLGALATIAGVAAVALAATPGTAHAWWRGGGIGIGIWVPPVVVAPAPVYVPRPVYAPPPMYPAPYTYAPPARVWVRPHWNGPYWVPGHWA